MAWQWKQRIVRTVTIILEGAKRQLVMKNWINYSINTSIINWTVNSYVNETQVIFKLMYASFWTLFVCPFFFAIGTCVCPQYFSVTARPSPLDNGGSRGLTEFIAGNIKKSCGFCKEYGETVLNFSKNNEGESSLTFPVSVTTPRGSKFSKFVAILEVPGVVVIRRRNQAKSSQGYYEEIITGSFLDKWSFFTVCLLAMYAAGVILWFLVSWYHIEILAMMTPEAE